MKTGTTLNKPKKGKGTVVVSWTGGKDGCFACYKAISEGFYVSYLLNFRDMKRSGSHEINPELLIAQSQAIGIPILYIDFMSYEEEFKKVIRNLKENDAGIDGAVFGHIETHKNLVDRICNDLDIELILPLWNRDPEQIISDFIDAGFEAIIVSAKADLLGKEWLGRKVNKKFVSDLRSFHNGLDLCGEFGEYHTFVIDGPMFKNRIRIVNSEKILKDGYWFLDIAGKKPRDSTR
jgi:diphthine-ammonia ligase